MTFKINMGQDGILRITLSGDMDRVIIENLRRDYAPYVNASTPENPLRNIFTFKNLGKLSSTARQYLTDLNKDPRYGLVAFIEPPRQARVLGRFITKATGRQNIQFFENEKQAVAWITSQEM